MLIIVNQNQKEISSSEGMKLSKENSDFLNYRVNLLLMSKKFICVVEFIIFYFFFTNIFFNVK
jgi:mevalonate pyrophosphate decarboxylase